MNKHEIIKQVRREVRMGRVLFLLSKQNYSPEVKLNLDKRSAVHYVRAYQLLKKVNR